ncbi:MAG: hypothetical protein IPG17_31780 [Sandaracinaceae bacterium]|nr:hypothetical protein [Sandaracinaceae bacterium]
MSNEHHVHPENGESAAPSREPLPPSFLERNAGNIQRAVVVVCALLVLADVAFSVYGHRHTHFGFEGYIGVYGAIGFAAYVGLVLSAKLLRALVMRPERYYDDREERS